MMHREFKQAVRRGGAYVSSRSAPSPATKRWATSATSEQVEKLFDVSVMEHLVCPISKYPLRYDARRGLIICPEIRVAYPIRNGIPLLVPSEGRILRDDEEA